MHWHKVCGHELDYLDGLERGLLCELHVGRNLVTDLLRGHSLLGTKLDQIPRLKLYQLHRLIARRGRLLDD